MPIVKSSRNTLCVVKPFHHSLLAVVTVAILALTGSLPLAGAPPEGDNAAFASQTAPATLLVGQTNLVTVRMVNRGTTTWRGADHYFLGSINPADNLTWGFNRVSLSAEIPPGQTAAFNFEIVAPLATGNYHLQWQMTREGRGFFGQPSSNAIITVTPPESPGGTLQRPYIPLARIDPFTNDAVFISQTVPTLLPAGGTAPITITLRNTGTTTWSEGDRYRICAINPIDNRTWGSRRVYLRSPVPPGASNTFAFSITAPALAGSYNFQWMMLQETIGRFGQPTPNVVIQVIATAARPPLFTQQPTNKTVAAGATAALTAAASGTPSPGLRWQRKIPGTADFLDLAGAIAGTFVTPVLLPTDSGTQFRCVATNFSGTATSAVATVTVTTPGIAPSFTQQPVSGSVLAGTTAEFTAAAAGTPPPALRWQSKLPGAPDFSDLAGAIAGTFVTPVLLPADNGTQFRCLATNFSGTATSAVATVTVTGTAPGFTLQPTNTSAFEEQTATFTAAATGTPAPTLQWQRKAAGAGQFTDISEATAGTYVTPALSLADHNSQFRCLASSPAGTATSAPATLVVSNTPPGFKRIHPKLELQSGDTVVFLGDSITYQALYTQYFENFFYTRFPNRRILFRNAGVANDRATNALVRFNDDVAAFRPKYVTLLLGMNDGGYSAFDKPTFDTYQRNMSALLDRIAQLGAVAVPLTPTMQDGRAARLRNSPSEPRDTHYNGVLGLYGAWLREAAYTRGLGFADVYAPLNRATTHARKTDALFTLIPDGIHPDATGHVIMAAALIADLGLCSPVSAIVIQENAGQLTATADNGQLADFTSGDRLSFTFTANSLPWVLPAEARPGYRLAGAGTSHSLEKLTVQNLPAGTYELRIDATPVGLYADGQLAAGIELQENELTPQFQQALRVAQFNKDKNATAVRPLRKWWEQLRDKRLELDKAIADQDPNLPAKRAAFAAWLTTFQAGVAALQSLVTTYEDQIYQANQPPPRRYELLRVPAAARAR